MHEATFCLAGADSYDHLTERFDATISLWCNDHTDLLLVESDPADSNAILESIGDFAGVEDAVVDGGRLVVATAECVKDLETTTVDAVLDEYGCLLLPPIRYRDGARSIRVLALESDRLTRCYHALLESFDVTVESKRDCSFSGFDRAPNELHDPLPSLSRRQRQVFATAHERGYYELPRETTMEDVAAEIGIDRRTADEHRRQAERKLLDAVADRYVG